MRPQYGHLYVADLNPRFGTEPGKIRPVVVVQTDALNKSHPSTIICPLTTKVADFESPLRVALPKGVSRSGHSSDILVDQIKAIDNPIRATRLSWMSGTGSPPRPPDFLTPPTPIFQIPRVHSPPSPTRPETPALSCPAGSPGPWFRARASSRSLNG